MPRLPAKLRDNFCKLALQPGAEFMEPNNATGDEKLRKRILIFSIILFLASLTQKSYCTTSSCGDSIMVFLLGWMAAFSGTGLAWFANPLLFAAWLTLRKNLKASMFLSVLAFLFCFLFLLVDAVPDDESGNKRQIISYEPGYWLWIASSVCMLLGTFTLMLRFNTRNARRQD